MPKEYMHSHARCLQSLSLKLHVTETRRIAQLSFEDSVKIYTETRTKSTTSSIFSWIKTCISNSLFLFPYSLDTALNTHQEAIQKPELGNNCCMIVYSRRSSFCRVSTTLCALPSPSLHIGSSELPQTTSIVAVNPKDWAPHPLLLAVSLKRPVFL